MLAEIRRRRRAIPRSVRDAVIARDGWNCVYCGQAVARVGVGDGHRPNRLHLDHVIPWAMGGPDTVDNLVVSCAACNLSRARPPAGSSSTHRPLLWEVEDGEYYWRDCKYRPPGSVSHFDTDPESLFTLEEAGEILRKSPVDVLVSATSPPGRLIRVTHGVSYPIRVVFDGDIWDVIERRMDELGWEK